MIITIRLSHYSMHMITIHDNSILIVILIILMMIIRTVRLLRVWISEGLTQADS